MPSNEERSAVDLKSAILPVLDRICAQSLSYIPEASTLDTKTVRYHVYFQRNIRVQIKK